MDEEEGQTRFANLGAVEELTLSVSPLHRRDTITGWERSRDNNRVGTFP